MIQINGRQIPAVILAGGQSSRMGGGDKTLLKLEHKSILSAILDRLSVQVSTVILNANGNPERFKKYNIQVIRDSLESQVGPLGGILSAMDWAYEKQYEYVMTVACDTPFFPKNLPESFCEELKRSGSSIVLASSKNILTGKKIRHPAFGVWRVLLRNDLRRKLNSGVRKVIIWTDSHLTKNVCFNYEGEDPFFNVNTFDDLIIARDRFKNYK